MGREIEIKIPLTDEEYKSIFSFVNGNTVHGLSHILKNDTYFSLYDTEEERRASRESAKPEPTVIRIRSEEVLDSEISGQKKSYFCYKFKTIENGVEFNSENESFIQNEEVIRSFLLAVGYKIYFEKTKDALSVYCSVDQVEFHLELEKVNGLKYVEIEVTQSHLSADLVKSALENFVTSLGLDASKSDSRSWMKIIGG